MSQIEIERRHDEAEAHIRATMMNELCEVMHRTDLPPMALLRLAARSVGSIYREMADAHPASIPARAAGARRRRPRSTCWSWR